MQESADLGKKERMLTVTQQLKELYAKQGRDWEEEMAQIEKEAEAKAKINELLMKGVDTNASD